MEDTTSNLDFRLSRKMTKAGDVKFHILQRQMPMAAKDRSLSPEGVPTPCQFEADLANPHSFHGGSASFVLNLQDVI